jgi:hypothetical protein
MHTVSCWFVSVRSGAGIQTVGMMHPTGFVNEVP